MATSKKSAAAASNPAADLKSATKLVQQSVERALKAKTLQPKIKGPIFCGIIYNPATKKFEAINQFE
jgi:hypothetical protein